MNVDDYVTSSIATIKLLLRRTLNSEHITQQSLISRINI